MHQRNISGKNIPMHETRMLLQKSFHRIMKVYAFVKGYRPDPSYFLQRFEIIYSKVGEIFRKYYNRLQHWRSICNRGFKKFAAAISLLVFQLRDISYRKLLQVIRLVLWQFFHYIKYQIYLLTALWGEVWNAHRPLHSIILCKGRVWLLDKVICLIPTGILSEF